MNWVVRQKKQEEAEVTIGRYDRHLPLQLLLVFPQSQLLPQPWTCCLSRQRHHEKKIYLVDLDKDN